MRRWQFLLPLGIFVILIILLGVGLTLNPREVPSPFINKPAPEFNLPQLLQAGQQVSPQQFRGRVWILNVWASWCVSCRAEHEVLNRLASKNLVDIIGLNYKDDTDNAITWLKRLGNPYKASVVDQDGRAGIDWGVYGVPETFVIDKQGIIRHKFTGPITEKDVEQTLIPLVKKLNQEAA